MVAMPVILMVAGSLRPAGFICGYFSWRRLNGVVLECTNAALQVVPVSSRSLHHRSAIMAAVGYRADHP
jgi:hypothetical protein